MFMMFERLSATAKSHREFRCPRCERWPRLVKIEPKPEGSDSLFECPCGVQIWDRAQLRESLLS